MRLPYISSSRNSTNHLRLTQTHTCGVTDCAGGQALGVVSLHKPEDSHTSKLTCIIYIYCELYLAKGFVSAIDGHGLCAHGLCARNRQQEYFNAQAHHVTERLHRKLIAQNPLHNFVLIRISSYYSMLCLGFPPVYNAWPQLQVHYSFSYGTVLQTCARTVKSSADPVPSKHSIVKLQRCGVCHSGPQWNAHPVNDMLVIHCQNHLYLADRLEQQFQASPSSWYRQCQLVHQNH